MTASSKPIGNLGLALSGGGSRAAAFHRGVLMALGELGLAERVDRLSTVSGGSVFGAAWMAARADRVTDDVFLADLGRVLCRGFILPALLSWRTLLMVLPCYTRTQRLAETFDALLLRGKRLADLPRSPLLCLNATVLNNAQAARFSVGGLSCADVGAIGDASGLPEFPLASNISLGFATAASAAFPFGLPPLRLRLAEIVGAHFVGDLSGHDALVLTDGGVLENLGVERLVRSGRFGAKHLIVSDAGVREAPWQPGRRWERLKNAGIFGLSLETLARLLDVMSSKQNRSMRRLVMQELQLSDTCEHDRVVLMVLVAQSWDRLLKGIPATRLTALAAQAQKSLPLPAADPESIRSFLAQCGIDLEPARRIYDAMGGDARAVAMNAVGTNFTGLSAETLDGLAQHARWQLHAVSAIFGPIPKAPVSPEAPVPS